MFSGIRNVIWNIRLRGWDYVKQYAGIAAGVSTITCLCGFGVFRTHHTLNQIVASAALERERCGRPEYLYFSDPAYEERIRQHLIEEDTWSPGPFLGRWVGGLRRAVWRRLLDISRNGNASDRRRALHHLAAIKHLKEWEWTWLSQRLDARAVVWLARHGGRCALKLTGGVPPLPLSVQSLPLLPILANLATATKHKRHCRCLETFLQEQTDRNQDVQRLMEQETSGGENKDVDENAEILSYLKTIHHHLDMSPQPTDRSTQSAEEIFVKQGGLHFVTTAALSTERAICIAAARLLLRLSHYPQLLPYFHRSGLISVMATWIENGDKDAELCCMAAGILASLENGSDEDKPSKEVYGPAVHLLHPTYRTQTLPQIDVVFVHGLLGEPFVTWRQRDRDDDDEVIQKYPCHDDDEFENINKFDIVLRDLPESAERDTLSTALIHRDDPEICYKEQQDLDTRTRCWPRDWLPKDCSNIRVLGVSYESMMMEWSSGCGDVNSTEDRAKVLATALKKAGVGFRPIVWVAHSMGGLLVKHMLVQSLDSKTSDDQLIAKNTKGIVFFSTPHHGSRAAQALIWSSKEVQELRKDSRILSSLHKRWLAGGWRSVCIGESLPTQLLSFPGLSLHLVPPDSANDNSGPFYTLPLDHLDICKPATRYSFIYRVVVEMVQHAKEEKCRKEDCEECENLKNKNTLNNSFIDKMSEELSSVWQRIMITFTKIPKNKSENDILYENIENNEIKDLKEQEEKCSKDITVDGWWLNIMNF